MQLEDTEIYCTGLNYTYGEYKFQGCVKESMINWGAFVPTKFNAHCDSTRREVVAGNGISGAPQASRVALQMNLILSVPEISPVRKESKTLENIAETEKNMKKVHQSMRIASRKDWYV
ncbi:hypothetical protein CBER1_05814 [Cercospora berteroae]|uniref:Uncharacterized protein n=1 Tax=Cercospora berteroae TaxID=357750 RepID=A0A2S6C2K6_9PEZI|nr:hypothetical protein CBER1_05814 [Cercospora berteroae]